jgi:hypothetical protein
MKYFYYAHKNLFIVKINEFLFLENVFQYVFLRTHQDSTVNIFPTGLSPSLATLFQPQFYGKS